MNLLSKIQLNSLVLKSVAHINFNRLSEASRSHLYWSVSGRVDGPFRNGTQGRYGIDKGQSKAFKLCSLVAIIKI